MTSSNLQPKEVILPPQPPGPVKWVRDNLFSSWLNSLMTIVLIPAIIYVIYQMIGWVLFTAEWTAVVSEPLSFAIGLYPRDEMWRIGVGLILILISLGASWGKWGGLLRSIALAVISVSGLLGILPIQHDDFDLEVFNIFSFSITLRIFFILMVVAVLIGYLLGRIKAVSARMIIICWIIVPVITLFLLSGFKNSETLPKVTSTAWGGLTVTLLLAVGGIVLSFPIGVLLALGRRSKLPVLSAFSTLFIELIRGVPLVTILFLFSFILNLLLPPEAIPERIVRALMAMTFFSAAYTAENVRGGLQAVPSGQIEAAKAVGMSGFQTMLLIVLPQALRAVLPAIVGQFISLFKDTTLVVIIGINDFLGIGRSIVNSTPEFVHMQLEVYLFIAVVYMIFSYLMSLASRQLEISTDNSKR